MPKKTPKPKKQEKSNKFDLLIDNFLIIIGDLKSGHIAFFSGAIFLLGIIFQLALVSHFLGDNSNSFSFMTLENTLLFSLLFISVFIIGAIFPPFFIFAFIGAFCTDDKNLQVYIMFGGVVVGIILFYFEWYRNTFLKHLKVFGLIYFTLFSIGSFIYYKQALDKKTSVEIITSNGSFNAELYFSNGAYYFIKKDGEKIILNSRDVKSVRIIK